MKFSPNIMSLAQIHVNMLAMYLCASFHCTVVGNILLENICWLAGGQNSP